VQAPHRSEPLHGGMTIVQLNLAYLRACGGARFKSLDHDPSFPGELSPAFYGSISGGLNIQGAQNNLRQIGI
jgi:hypothetical protein